MLRGDRLIYPAVGCPDELPGQLAIFVRGGEVVVWIHCEPEGPRECRFPLSIFEDEAQLSAWAEKTVQDFAGTFLRPVAFAVSQHLFDLAHFGLYFHGHHARVSKDDVLNQHLKASEDDLKRRFGWAGRGRHSKWERLELLFVLEAILEAKPALAAPWADIRAEIKRALPDKAPASGESLRKLAASFGITLRGVKRRLRRKKLLERKVKV